MTYPFDPSEPGARENHIGATGLVRLAHTLDLTAVADRVRPPVFCPRCGSVDLALQPFVSHDDPWTFACGGCGLLVQLTDEDLT